MKPNVCLRHWPVLLLWTSLVFSAGIALAQPASELFFTEYVEGSSYNKAVEIGNGTGVAKDLAAGIYDIQIFYNGSVIPSDTIALTGTVAAGDVHVVAHGSANQLILDQTDQTNSNLSFNGDDAVVLRRNGVILDVIGQIGFDPGSEWGSGLTSTADNTLRRKNSISSGDTNGSDPFDPSAEWDGYATDTLTGLGHHDLGSALPLLTVTKTDTNTVLVAWPGSETGWLLQATTNPGAGGGGWTEIPPPYETLGTNSLFNEPVAAGDKFYRLHKPRN